MYWNQQQLDSSYLLPLLHNLDRYSKRNNIAKAILKHDSIPVNGGTLA